MWVNVKTDEAVIQVKWIKATLVAAVVTCVASIGTVVLVSGYGVSVYRLMERMTLLEESQQQSQQQSQSPLSQQQSP